MSAIIRLYDHAIIDMGSRSFRLGSMVHPKYVECDGEKIERYIDIPVVSTETLWDASSSALSDFDFLWVQSNIDVYLELVTDQNNDVGKIAYVIEIQGSETGDEAFGPPFKLCSDASYAGNSQGFTGTVDTIEMIQVRNPDTSDEATVYFVLMT